MKVSTTTDSRLTSEESEGARNERSFQMKGRTKMKMKGRETDTSSQKRKCGKFHTINPSKGESEGGVNKRSFAQGEGAKRAKDQRLHCKMDAEFSGEAGRFGVSLDGRGKFNSKGKFGPAVGTKVMNGCPRGLCTSYRAKSMKGDIESASRAIPHLQIIPA
jgi:hypothetical protein